MPRKAVATTEKVATKSAKKSEVTAAPKSVASKAVAGPATDKPVVKRRVTKPKRSEPAAPSQAAPSQEDIARLAYHLWELRGRPHGSEQEDWYRAEVELSR